MTSKPTIDAVVLTMNDRPEEFPEAMASLLSQVDVDLRVVVVGNGCEPEQVPCGVSTIALDHNAGIPEGRNIGADALKTGEFIFFFDNDAKLPATDTLARLAAEFERHPEAAYVQPRIIDPDGHTTMRRWVPRLRAKTVDRPGTVTVMAEGVVLIRRDDYDRTGGWPGHFFLFHEGVDLALRLWNLGKTGWYAPEIHITHPATDPARHSTFYHCNARNRVWLAYRNLPMPLIPIYLTTRTLLTLSRLRSRTAVKASIDGLREGFTTRRDQKRNPIKWRTIARLAIAGRPPII